MLSDREYITQSLELNLFFMRIAKEHSIFIEAAFVPKNNDLARQANGFKRIFESLLYRTIRLSEGLLSPQVSSSNEIVTDLTYEAERETEFYSGIPINSSLTRGELQLVKGAPERMAKPLVERIHDLNEEALQATRALAAFKSKLLQDVLACRLFTMNYPLLLDHILREARFYIKMIRRLQNRDAGDSLQDMAEQEIFWNRIMAEHSKFIRGLLDPTENDLIQTANNFGIEFDKLTAEAEMLTTQLGLLPTITSQSLDATIRVRDFKKTGTEGLLDCKIRSIALPLLGDHVMREANHYIRLLKSVGTQK